MTAKRDELDLIEGMPDDPVEALLEDAHRLTGATPKGTWPPKFVGMIKDGPADGSRPSTDATCPDGMVTPALQSAIEAMSACS